MLHHPQTLGLQTVFGQCAQQLTEALGAMDNGERTAPLYQIACGLAQVVHGAAALVTGGGALVVGGVEAALHGEVRGIGDDQIKAARVEELAVLTEVTFQNVLGRKAVGGHVLTAYGGAFGLDLNAQNPGLGGFVCGQHCQYPRTAAQIQNLFCSGGIGEVG